MSKKIGIGMGISIMIVSMVSSFVWATPPEHSQPGKVIPVGMRNGAQERAMEQRTIQSLAVSFLQGIGLVPAQDGIQTAIAQQQWNYPGAAAVAKPTQIYTLANGQNVSFQMGTFQGEKRLVMKIGSEYYKINLNTQGFASIANRQVSATKLTPVPAGAAVSVQNVVITSANKGIVIHK